MDESWRMRMGMPSFPHRKSMEDTSTFGSTTRRSAATVESLNPDNFADVFGGPPRRVFSRKFSGDFFTDRSLSFYEEIFRPAADQVSPSETRVGGRSLQGFRIPAARNEGFYRDVFRTSSTELSGGGRRSRERSRPTSKTKSDSTSSVLSSEDVSPFRPVIKDDVALNSFASKLRPINIPCRWSTEQPERRGMPAFECTHPSFVENEYIVNDYHQNFKSSYHGYSRRATSPETISLEPNSYGNVKISTDDLEFNSPSSPVSSLRQETSEPKPGNMQSSNNTMQEQGEEEQEEDEVMSSYVIEINSDYREGTSGEAVSIGEAIAWAKETFQRQSSELQQETGQSLDTDQCDRPERSNSHELLDQHWDGHGTTHSPKAEEQKNWTTEEEKEHSEEQMEMELLDEDIKLWSAGKETNIRLLLSTIHHILWPSSGWYPISSMNLIESSQVKKAYQKAKLCLHPDKLQQRGTTLPKKYVAEKAFSILQDAWEAFISQDDLF